MDKIYSQYAERLREVGQAEDALATKKAELKQIYDELKQNKTQGDGSIGLEVSSHAFVNISDRIQRLAMESATIYDDVFNTDQPQLSILWPSNLRAFIITLLAQALEKGAVVQKQSKNNRDGSEYHYTVSIEKWSGGGDGDLVFTGVVEGCTIKTGFFNWV